MKSSKLIVTFGICAILLNNWLLGLALNHHLIFAGGSISELSALTQSYHQVFRVLDIVSGLLFLLCGLLLAKTAVTKIHRAVVFCLGAVGVAQIVDAALAMPCSGTVDHACNIPVRLNPAHFYIPAHTYSSVVLGLCFLLLPILGVFLVRKYRRFWWLSVATIAVTLTFFGLLLAASASGYFVDSLGVGISQEIQMLLLGVWLVSLPIYWPGDLRHQAGEQKGKILAR